MLQQSDYHILIKAPQPGALSLATIVGSARQCTPIDVRLACSNIDIAEQSAGLPDDVAAFASFVLRDFFAFAHGTGLYNRQKKLWEALGRVTEIQCYQARKGWFNKVNELYTDVLWLDGRGNTLVFGSLAQGSNHTLAASKRFINKAIARARKIQKQQGFLLGVFLGMSGIFSQELKSLVKSKITAIDHIAFFESKLKPPINASLNVLKIDRAINGSNSYHLSLVHPNFQQPQSSK